MSTHDESTGRCGGLNEPHWCVRPGFGMDCVVVARGGSHTGLARKTARGIIAAIALALGSTLAAEIGSAQEVVDAATSGRRLALQLCSGCHFVAPGQRLPMAVNAPPFQAIANSPDTTEFRLRNALRVPHPIMPTLILSPEEAENLVAYILSLKSR